MIMKKGRKMMITTTFEKIKIKRMPRAQVKRATGKSGKRGKRGKKHNNIYSTCSISYKREGQKNFKKKEK